MSIFSNLPTYIIAKIIEYNDVISYRTGKYINRIKNNDYRYQLLMTIPQKDYDEYSNEYSVYLPIDDDNYLYMVSEMFNNNNNYICLIKYHWYKSILYVEIEGDLDGYDITNNIKYKIN